MSILRPAESVPKVRLQKMSQSLYVSESISRVSSSSLKLLSDMVAADDSSSEYLSRSSSCPVCHTVQAVGLTISSSLMPAMVLPSRSRMESEL